MSGRTWRPRTWRCRWTWRAAAKTADYQSPRLARHASGDALSTLVKALYDVKQRSVVVKGELLLAPQVISLTPSQAAPEATVVDCSDDSHWLAYKLDGSIEDNTHGGQRHVEAIVENDRGVWRVTKLAVLSFRS